MKIDAIIFDCFGVLATDGLLPFRQKYFGNKPELLEEVRNLSKQVDAGLASYDELVKKMADLAGLSLAEVHNQIEHNVPDEVLFAYIKDELKPRYKIGMLSNAGDNWLDEIFTPEQIHLFDAVALSYEIHAIKPDPRAYEIAAQRLGVPLEACVFVDDQERYCTGAREVGMQAMYYQGLDDLKQKLSVLF